MTSKGNQECSTFVDYVVLKAFEVGQLRLEQFQERIQNTHFVWLKEIIQEARKAFDSEEDAVLLPKTPCMKRKRRGQNSQGRRRTSNKNNASSSLLQLEDNDKRANKRTRLNDMEVPSFVDESNVSVFTVEDVSVTQNASPTSEGRATRSGRNLRPRSTKQKAQGKPPRKPRAKSTRKKADTVDNAPASNNSENIPCSNTVVARNSPAYVSTEPLKLNVQNYNDAVVCLEKIPVTLPRASGNSELARQEHTGILIENNNGNCVKTEPSKLTPTRMQPHIATMVKLFTETPSQESKDYPKDAKRSRKSKTAASADMPNSPQASVKKPRRSKRSTRASTRLSSRLSKTMRRSSLSHSKQAKSRKSSTRKSTDIVVQTLNFEESSQSDSDENVIKSHEPDKDTIVPDSPDTCDDKTSGIGSSNSSDDMDQPLKKTMHNASNAESTFTCTPNRELVVAASSPNLVKVSAHEISIHKEHVLQNNLDKTYEKFMEIPDFNSTRKADNTFEGDEEVPAHGSEINECKEMEAIVLISPLPEKQPVRRGTYNCEPSLREEETKISEETNDQVDTGSSDSADTGNSDSDSHASPQKHKDAQTCTSSSAPEQDDNRIGPKIFKPIRPVNIVTSVASFIKKNTPKRETIQEKKQKLEEDTKKREIQRKRMIQQAEIRRQQEIEKRKLRREERERKVAENQIKKVREEEERKRIVEERLKQAKKNEERSKKLKEREEEQKRRMREKKQAEAELRRKQEEEDRQKKMREREEQEKRKAEFLARKAEYEEQERKRKIAEQKRMEEIRLQEVEQERKLQEERKRREIEEREKKRDDADKRVKELKERQEERMKKERDEKLKREKADREDMIQREKELRAINEKLQKARELRDAQREEADREKVKEKIKHELMKQLMKETNTKPAPILKHSPIHQPLQEKKLVNTEHNRQNQMVPPSVPVKPSSQITSYKTPTLKKKETSYVSYKIDDMSSDDSTDDEDQPQHEIPKWARGAALKAAILNQAFLDIDPDEIFANCFPELRLEKLFAKKRERFFKRTSSACWDSPILKHKIASYV